MIPPLLKMSTRIGNAISILMISALIHLLSSCSGTSRLESLIPYDKQWPEGIVRMPSGRLFINTIGTPRGFPPGISSKEPLALYFRASTDYIGCEFSIEDIRITYEDGTEIMFNPIRLETKHLTIADEMTDYKIFAPKSPNERIVLSFRLSQREGRHSFTRNYSVSFRYDTSVENIKYNPLLDIT